MRVPHYRQVFSKLSETFIYDRLTELERQGVDNHVVTRERTNAETRPFPSITKVDWPKKWDPWRLVSGIRYRLDPRRNGQESYRQEPCRRLAAVARGISADVIHAHFGREGIFIAPVAERLGIPLVVTFYGYDISSLPQKEGWREKYRALWKQVGAITVLSEEMRRRVQELGCPEEKLTVVHLSRHLDQFPFRPLASDVKTVLFVGRLTPKKAPLDALRAVQRANEIGAGLHLEVIGDGECRDETERYVDEHDLAETVTLRGYLSNEKVGARMRAADVFLLSSKTAPNGDREGTPTVLVEAQATGLPCVTTRHSGIPEMIPRANQHLLVEEGNVEGLADALCDVTESDPEELKAIARRGREKVERDFKLSKEVKTLRSTYQRLHSSREVHWGNRRLCR